MINSFTFYRDYFNLIDTMPKEDKIKLLLAIVDYMFKDKEPDLVGHNQAIFNTLKAQLNVSKNNAGRGGRPKKEETEQKPIEKPIENQDNNRSDNRLKNKTSISNFKFYISNLDINNNIKDIIYKWLEYKLERKEYYKETGFNTLVNKIIEESKKYGEQTIIDLINYSMANNYMGIVWDRLKNQKTKHDVPDWFDKEIKNDEEMDDETRRIFDEITGLNKK